MRTDTVFEINNIDFSSHVLAGTYNVIEVPVYTEWTDANLRDHREVTRKRVQGSFDMFFETVTAYEDFVTAYNAAKTDSGLTPAVIMNNTTNELVLKNCYFSFSPVRNRRDDWEDFYETFTVDVREW